MKLILNKKRIIIALLIFPYLEPEYFINMVPTLHMIYNVLKAITAIIGLFLFIKNKVSIRVILPIVAINAMLLFSTYQNKGDTTTVIINAISALAFSIILCWAIKDAVNCLKALLFVYSVLIYINFITVIVFPNGLYTRGGDLFWLLGYHNAFIFYFIPAICVSFLLSLITKGRIEIKSVLLLSVCTITLLIRWSATSTVSLLILWVYLILEYVINMPINLNPKVMTGTILCINVAFVIFRIESFFSYIIVHLLHKDMSLSGRNEIWDRALQNIPEKPIIGHGYSELKFVLSNYLPVTHCQNYMLNTVYETGFIGLAIFLWNIVLVVNRLMKFKKNKCSKIVTLSIFMMLLVLVFDCYIKPVGVYLLFILGYYIKNIIESSKIKKIKQD